MKKNDIKKILEHPDKDEIISKLIIGINYKDIYEGLKAKYTNISEKKFVLSEKSIKNFQENYLDIYTMIQEDISKTKIAVKQGIEDDLELAIKNNSKYKEVMLRTAEEELDVRKMIKNMCVATEIRFAQIFDSIQEDPNSINTRLERVILEYADKIRMLLETYYKFTEAPADQIIQHNITLQTVDQHIAVFHEVIRKVLSSIDIETSLHFMELFNEEISKVKSIDNNYIFNSTEDKMIEVKLLNETINKKINE